MSDRIQRGRERIHGAHKDDPQWREWLKLYLDGDKVGPFTKEMVEFLVVGEELVASLNIDGSADVAIRGFRKIAAALSSLWKEGDDA